MKRQEVEENMPGRGLCIILEVEMGMRTTYSRTERKLVHLDNKDQNKGKISER